MAKIIAYDGGNRYLVSLNGDWQTVRDDLTAMGQVVDVSLGIRMQPFHLHALISRGEWMEFTKGREEEFNILNGLNTKPAVPSSGVLCAT